MSIYAAGLSMAKGREVEMDNNLQLNEEVHGGPIKRFKRKKEIDSSHESTPVPGDVGAGGVGGGVGGAGGAGGVIRIRPPALQPNYLEAIAHPPILQPIEILDLSGGAGSVESLPKVFSTEDHPHNKRGFRYLQCSGNPELSSVLYSIAEVEPLNARISYEDRSSQVFISQDGLSVTTNHGFRSARANVVIREGEWYYETRILRANDASDKTAPDAHVRLGIMRREASLEAPPGHDAYGYGFRDVNGDKVHKSRPSTFMGESFKTGDTIGIYINIPRNDNDSSSSSSSSNPLRNIISPNNITRDRIPIKYKGQLYFESLDYVPAKQMDELILPTSLYNKKRKESERFQPAVIPGSYIKVFKNGRDMGIAFHDLIEFLPPHCQFQKNMAVKEADDGQAGYYPTISVFRGGMAEFNFGPNFDYPPPAAFSATHPYKPVSQRYDEQIADDIVYDLVDQVDFEIIDKLEDERLAQESLLKAKHPKSTLQTTTTASSTSPTPNIVEIAPTPPPV